MRAQGESALLEILGESWQPWREILALCSESSTAFHLGFYWDTNMVSCQMKALLQCLDAQQLDDWLWRSTVLEVEQLLSVAACLWEHEASVFALLHAVMLQFLERSLLTTHRLSYRRLRQELRLLASICYFPSPGLRDKQELLKLYVALFLAASSAERRYEFLATFHNELQKLQSPSFLSWLYDELASYLNVLDHLRELPPPANGHVWMLICTPNAGSDGRGCDES